MMSVCCALPYRPVHLVLGRVPLTYLLHNEQVYREPGRANCSGVVRRLLRSYCACVLPTTRDLFEYLYLYIYPSYFLMFVYRCLIALCCIDDVIYREII